MKKVFTFVFLLTIVLNVVLGETKEYQDSVQVSFTAGIVGNFGFSTSAVNSTVKPSDIENGLIEFTRDSKSNNYTTNRYYIYYQIFTNEQLNIYATATPLTIEGTDNQVSWTDSVDTLNCDSNKKLIFPNISADNKKFDSLPFQLVITEPEIANSTGFFTATAEKPFTGTITITIEPVGA